MGPLSCLMGPMRNGTQVDGTRNMGPMILDSPDGTQTKQHHGMGPNDSTRRGGLYEFAKNLTRSLRSVKNGTIGFYS
jgi:hypothetical protein